MSANGTASQMPAGDCVLFSSADWEDRYWTNKQHTAVRLASRGWRVLYVDSTGFRPPNLGSGIVWRRIGRRLARGARDFILGARKVRPSLWVISPIVIPIWKANPVVVAINRFLLQHPLRRVLRRQRFEHPLVWTYHPFIHDALDAIRPERLVYHCVDDLSVVPGVDTSAFDAAEGQLLRRADAVFTTSLPLQAKCAALTSNAHYFSNVADVDHFGTAFAARPVPEDLRRIPQPRLGYHGVLTNFKLDFGLLLEIARLHPEWHIVLIGEERQGQADPTLAELVGLPNVHALGYRPYSVLPDYLRGIDVGLLPVDTSAFAQAIFPMKLYEYLAAGVPVVSTPAPYATGDIPRLLIGEGPQAFAGAISAQLAAGRLTESEAREAVGPNTWDERLSRMLAIVAATKPTIQGRGA